MTSDTDIKGVWTAITTPFKEDLSIDWSAFEKHVRMQVEAGIDGIVVAGTTGESPTLDDDEKIALVRFVKKIAPELKLMAGTGSNNTRNTANLTSRAHDAGADIALVVTPPYNKPSLVGLEKHYEKISEACSIPICLYHVPGRTAQSLTSSSLAHLCKSERIVAVKEASGDLNLFSQAHLLSNQESRCRYLSGDDPTFLSSLAVGGSGVISVISNIFPKQTKAIYDAFNQHQHEMARKIHETLLPVMNVLFSEPNPAPVKHILAQTGIMGDFFRLPMVPVSAPSSKQILGYFEIANSQLQSLE